MALSVAAAYCDFDHQVMHNRAGVVCVFTNQRLGNVQYHRLPGPPAPPRNP